MADESLVLSMPWMSLPWDVLGDGVRRVEDRSGHGNHATPVSFAGTDVEFVDGHLGQALNLPGGGAFKGLNCGNDDSIAVMQQVSVEVIITPNSIIGSQDIIGKYAPCTYLMFTNGTSIYFYVGGVGAGNNARALNAFVLGKPLHIIGTHDGVNTSIYIDGVWVDDANTPLSPVMSSYDLYIGRRYNSTNEVNGLVHRVRIWRRALGAAEIYNRYKNRHRLAD